MTEFIEIAAAEVVLCDGAMGTVLRNELGALEGCLDALNLQPEWAPRIRDLHRRYRKAGARLLQTNTYGANRIKLERYDQQANVATINLAAAELARQAAEDACFVAGSVGPLELLRSDERYTEDGIREVYAEQMDALVGAGVDLLLLETFQDDLEARAAVAQAKSYGLPVVFQVGGFQHGRTAGGADVAALVAAVDELGADVIGANCRSPFDILEAVRLIASVTTKPISAQPNAGTPRIDRARVVYDMGPREIASRAAELVAAGATILGTCCGSSPEHTAALREAVAGLVPAPRSAPTRVMLRPVREAVAPAQVRRENPVRAVLERTGIVISAEIRPSRKETLASILEGAQTLADAGVDLFDVPDNAGARVARDAMATAWLIQERTHLPTILHKASTQCNLLSLQSYLLGAWDLGLRGVLAITGDHPNVGDHDKYASRVTDLKSSVDLIRLIVSLNQGRLFNNEPLVSPTDFAIGCGFNPARNPKAQLKWLERKAEAGAEFVFTQPLYRLEDVERMRDDTAPFTLKFLLGILPLASRRNAEFLAAGHIPGIVIPEEILERFRRVESTRAQQALGLSLARDLVEHARGIVDGFYFILPFGSEKYEWTAALIRAAKGTVARQPVG